MKLINERPRENKGGVNVSWDLRTHNVPHSHSPPHARECRRRHIVKAVNEVNEGPVKAVSEAHVLNLNLHFCTNCYVIGGY